ncbi:MAG: tRNA pseudouridine(13) synthase TruD [Planctomycetaceae bacterium]|nr:tRNA pseudouridine(13) synthase TruD [Planctomycetaceae bacterium]
MKLKRLPEDFRVVELSDFPATGGPFACYRLTKTGLGTPEAIAAIQRRWQLPSDRIAYGGLKDRHAVTTQFVTIYQGPPRGLEQQHLRLEYLGPAARPFQPSDIRANQFALALRDFGPEQTSAIVARIEQATRDGVANYFDEQRFGSLGTSGEFIARAWCAGDWERTLWLALAEANRHDTPRIAQLKELLRARWGDWRGILAQLPRSGSHVEQRLARVIEHLAARPSDFRGAIAKIDPQQRGLYLASFQSFLWNRMLAALLRATCRPEQLAAVEIGPDRLPFFGSLDDAQRGALTEAQLPLPSARLHLEPGPTADLIQATLADAGIELRQLRVKYPRDSFFAKGERRVVVRPAELRFAWEADELHPQRQKLLLDFELPRGSYATILVKRLTELDN